MSPELEAARITAKATIHAAHIQGEWTFGAGLFVLVGGILALAGAYIAAKILSRLEESKHRTLVAAYRTRMEEVVVELADICFLNQLHLTGAPDTIVVEPFSVPDELNPSNWKDHAMLGDQTVPAISDVYRMAKLLFEFSREMRGKPAADGKIMEAGIDTFRVINKSLDQQVKTLQSALKQSLYVSFDPSRR